MDSISYNLLKHTGKYRSLKEESFLQKETTKKALILVTAFIENGLWFQIKVGAQSFREFLSGLGFDVYILSFIPEMEQFIQNPYEKDVSFHEIVFTHFPNFHTRISNKYEEIHYITHSYGSTLTTCFLLNSTSVQKNVKSFISIAGVYKLAMPHFMRLILEKFLTYMLSRSFHYLPMNNLKPLQKIPYLSEGVDRILKIFPINQINPIFNANNVDSKAFLQALTGGGSSNETVEAAVTLFGLLTNWQPKNNELKSVALIDFSQNLGKFNYPILMLVGEKDVLTTPKNCQEYGYNLVKSERKKLIILPNTGHQDVMAPRDPSLLRNHIRDWLLSF